ncbi:hypothetical protein ABPG72_019898 [Tetrahymena utriculariae]
MDILNNKQVGENQKKQKVNLFWFRRDLRLNDNVGLYYALKESIPVVPLFIFDKDILNELEDKKDCRVEFIHNYLSLMQENLRKHGSTMIVKHSNAEGVFMNLMNEFDISCVFTNRDYEPYAKKRDQSIKEILNSKGIEFKDFKDQVIFEAKKVHQDDGSAFKIYTPFSKKWISLLSEPDYQSYKSESLMNNYWKSQVEVPFPTLEQIGFQKTGVEFPPSQLDEELVKNYDKTRDYPHIKTSLMSVHLRFGTVSIRELVRKAVILNQKYLDELCWREFFMMMIDQFPLFATENLKKAYNKVEWRNNPEEFKAWCEGKTGYPLLDAGMRQLNKTGYLPNKLRMIAASFLTKNLLIDWRWGERYFAKKLIDYDLAANVGGWQWVNGSGTDQAPYIRVLDPVMQQKKYDPDFKYINTWVEDFNEDTYPKIIVNYEESRQRALDAFSIVFKKNQIKQHQQQIKEKKANYQHYYKNKK